jgi:3-deoxy-D-manno-octulosonic-acid transferase
MGLLSSLYALADVTFVGGSLVKKGGQNPIEPAAAGKPVLFGPDMSDFPEIARWLLDKGGAISVRTSDDLADHARRLLANPSLARAMGSKARSVVDEHQGCNRKIVADIVAFLADEPRHLA